VHVDFIERYFVIVFMNIHRKELTVA